MSEYQSSISVIDGCIVASFSGEITTHHCTEFRNDYNEIFRRLVEAEDKRVILDLTETTFFGSMFVGIIMKLAMQINRQNGTMLLCGLSPQLSQLMQSLLLLEKHSDTESHLQHAATREEAIEKIGRPKSGWGSFSSGC